MKRHLAMALTIALTALIGLFASRARAVDRTFAGSAQLDYAFVPTQKGNVNHDGQVGEYGFDGFTLEAAGKLAVDVSDHVSANVKLCFGCHGFEADMAYVDYRPLDEFYIRAGRFSPSFGAFNLRHDVGNHKLSDKPLPYDMGRMLRMRTWNMGVLPSPFPDSGVQVGGLHWFGESTQLDYAAYAVAGFRNNGERMTDLNFADSRARYYVDNNARPTVGAHLAITQKLGSLSDFTLGGSAMYGTYDINNDYAYGILGGELTVRIKRTALRMEYLVRRTEFDSSNPDGFAFPVTRAKDSFLKHGAYIELEQPLSPSVDLIARVDGLYRIGNFLTEEDELVPLARKSSIVRYTLGGSYAFERGFRLKVSTEFWQFSDKDENGKNKDVSIHTAFVGTY